MNGKYLKLFGILTVGFLFLISIFWALISSDEPASPGSQSGPVISLPTQTGEVKVKDFTSNPVEQTADTLVFEKDQAFDLVYFPEDKAILITLYTQPLQQARDQAEQKLLDELGIGRGEACKLNVTVTVPFSVDPELAGKNYGLSFCPNSISF